jgi:Uma2 family endonuclease
VVDVRPSTRPPRVLNVVRNPIPGEWEGKVDWSAWYLTDEEDMGESPEQGKTIRLLVAVLGQLFRARAIERVLVGGDNFFAWVPHEPLVRVSPDIYVVEDPPPPPLPASWQTWRPGHRPPAIAFEVVSDDWRKDYRQAPEKYAQLGAGELFIFDSVPPPSGGRVPLQHYRRLEDGNFVLTASGQGPFYSPFLDAWVRIVSDGPVTRLRLSLDARGVEMVPTPEEVAARERVARETAEAENARLREELERLRKG